MAHEVSRHRLRSLRSRGVPGAARRREARRRTGRIRRARGSRVRSPGGRERTRCGGALRRRWQLCRQSGGWRDRRGRRRDGRSLVRARSGGGGGSCGGGLRPRSAVAATRRLLRHGRRRAVDRKPDGPLLGDCANERANAVRRRRRRRGGGVRGGVCRRVRWRVRRRGIRRRDSAGIRRGECGEGGGCSQGGAGRWMRLRSRG